MEKSPIRTASESKHFSDDNSEFRQAGTWALVFDGDARYTPAAVHEDNWAKWDRSVEDGCPDWSLTAPV